MSHDVTIRVTYLDGQVRAFAINDAEDPDPFYTWYVHVGEHQVEELIIKRRSKSRVIVLAALIRHIEVILEKPLEQDDEVRPDPDEHDTSLSQALAEDRGHGCCSCSRCVLERVDRNIQRVVAAQQAFHAPEPDEDQRRGLATALAGPEPDEGVSVYTGEPIPATCPEAHRYNSEDHNWSKGMALVSGKWWRDKAGSHQRCSQCGAVRDKR